MATDLGSEVEESGDSTEDLLFRLPRKGGASPETNDFRCNFQFTRLLIVRERVGVESKVTPLSKSQEMSSLLGYIMGLIDDRW